MRPHQWREEELPAGAVRMTVGDIDKAPPDPEAQRTDDYRAPADPTECGSVRIIKVTGWWCSTTVRPIVETGQIVVGGGRSGASMHGPGFSTVCSHRPGQVRQLYQIQRDSWSGWRSYTDPTNTDWTSGQRQVHGRVSAPCPKGRVGTYNYRLTVSAYISGYPVGHPAGSAQIRTSCGTGGS